MKYKLFEMIALQKDYISYSLPEQECGEGRGEWTRALHLPPPQISDLNIFCIFQNYSVFTENL